MINRRLIRIKVLQVLYAHSKKNEGASSILAEKELFHSIEKFYDLYLLILLLGIELSALERERIILRKNKKIPSAEDINPNTRFSENAVSSLLSSDKAFLELCKTRKVGWGQYKEIPRRIFNDLINSELYEKFMSSEDDSIAFQKDFFSDFFSEFLSENQYFIEFLEEENIYWNDDSNFAIMMAIKTIDNIKPANPRIRILPLFKNDDDKEFAKKLIRKVIVNKEEFTGIVKVHAQNWDTERIAQIDLLILQMAIAELIEFSSIPVKVTLNEFIEISKYYSTDKSKIFINGVLDNIIKELLKSGKIKKTGRGLIE
jgi:transcription antitermination protein NusB